MVSLIVGAGDFPSVLAALEAGADAVYFGVKDLHMRAFSQNFELNEMKKVVTAIHSKNAKAYLTLNALITENELPKLDRIIREAKTAEIDAVIAWDFSVIKKCFENNIPVHLSTQAGIANHISADFFKQFGAEMVVLARETTLDEIKKIKKATDLSIEVFVHGSMCSAVSGRCFLSHDLFGKSANKGECVQPCRRAFLVEDKEKEILVGPDYILSAKDLCTIEFLEKIIDVGVDALKIEGRSKPSDYVFETTKAYRKAIDLIEKNQFTDEKKKELKEKLEKVYNRGYSSGFFFGEPENGFVDKAGTHAHAQRFFVGVVKNYFQKIGVAEIKIFKQLKKDDQILIEGKTTFLRQKCSSMQFENNAVDLAENGQSIGLKVDSQVRPNDKVFALRPRTNLKNDEKDVDY